MVKLGLLFKILGAVLLAGFVGGCTQLIEGAGRELQPLSLQTVARLNAMGSSPGAAMMVRIYKESSLLEVWKQVEDGTFKLFKTYPICTFSGELGPKIFEGDRQSPEGFYTVTRGMMNPRSQLYLSFNIGFPNKFDRAYGRTGSNIMVHGACSSRGCYAMTDKQVAEIYALARESFNGGNRSFQVQIYPFDMTPENLARFYDSPNLSYWRNLKTGYDYFELTKRPPDWDVCNKQYVFDAKPRSGKPLDARAACPPLVTNSNILAQVKARESADQATFELAVASIKQSAAQKQMEAERQAANQRALKQRGAALDKTASGFGDAVGGFFSGLFGGGQNAGQTQPIIYDPNAPIPAPPLMRN
ncbi:probable exported protein STY0357 [hydrothermal vent metagenome]|uniref:Probable exported protein STY0357 n=1 Tax=hydrothermal vent metagenome TaxID=652676 RepID=A0A3B0TY27_9ZZZZ